MPDTSDIEMMVNSVEDGQPQSMDLDRPKPGSEEKLSDEADWIRLQSQDGFSYLVRRKVARVSGTIRNMLDPAGGYTEANSRVCEIRERGIIVEKLVEYMCFKSHYETVGPKEDIPVKEFLDRLPPELVLELLLAADYQDM